MNEYRKVMTRAMSLAICEIWDEAERVRLPELCEKNVYFTPLFLYVPEHDVIEVYYDYTDPGQDPKNIENYITEHWSHFNFLKKQFDLDCDEVRELTASDKPEDLSALADALTRVWPLIAIASPLGEIAENEKLREWCLEIRKESDGVLHWGEIALVDKIRGQVPDEYKKWSESLLLKEVLEGSLPSQDDLERRATGFLFHNGKTGQSNLDTYSSENGITIVQEVVRDPSAVSKVTGQIACEGSHRGRVACVFGRKDMEKVKEGCVMVSPMTTPELVEAMKRAGAFVTDEGGVTCHAAIVAREMGKPCIIGTRVATQVLKDGDEVEVDANEGIVTILNKAQ